LEWHMKLRMPFGRRTSVPRVDRSCGSNSGWQIDLSDGAADSPLREYVAQLVDEKYATTEGTGFLIPWSRLFDLLEDQEHAASVGLLDLPPVSHLVPRLESSGTPGEEAFSIAIGGWVHPSGRADPLAAKRIGAVLEVGGKKELMSRTVFELVETLLELGAEGVRMGSEQRMRATGRVQLLARKCGATLDHYLAETPINVPCKLDIDLRMTEAMDASVVELTPKPVGAPSGWIDQFDRYDSVRPRYDVVDSDGRMSHVLMGAEMRDVLAPIKAVPGRRYASREADAFLHNPYSFLGESAETILPVEAFEQAKQRAGLNERELDATPEADGWDVLLIDPAGTADAISESLDVPAQVQKLVADASEARRLGFPVFRWKSHRIALTGATLESLGRLQKWLAADAVGTIALRVGEVFNLQAYSDRVVGFDGKPIHVPFIGQKDASRDWIPENMELTVATVNPQSGDVSTAHLDAGGIAQLKQATLAAHQNGARTVALPGSNVEIPIEEANAWIDGMKEVLRKKPNSPAAPKDPKPSDSPRLSILHNIEQLEYGAEPALKPTENATAEMPDALRASVGLMPHQQAGLAWMQHRFKQRKLGVRGVLLADDMGLGKTLQCLCLMAWYREVVPSPKPCLVVAPVSLLENWKAEIDKWLDGRQGRTIALYGNELARHRLLASELEPDLRELGLKKFLRPGFSQGAGIVLTTYETLRDYDFSLGREAWGILVCDEAQKIKTPGALVTRAAKAMQAEFKIACTGTPVENTLADLWCLFDFFQPALLGSLSEFTKAFRKSIEMRAEGHEVLVERLRNAIEPWVLRRMKHEVAQLPPKIDDSHPDADRTGGALPMSVLQKSLYGHAVSEFKQALEDTDKGGGAAALMVLHRLRMICANPLSASDDKAELLPVRDHLRHSPKLQWLLEQLDRIRHLGEKAIVFTEYREIQRLLKRAIAGRFGISVQVVNGSTAVDPENDLSRQRIIDEYQAKPGFGVIILSTTAVGFGVNIQAANHVIHYTRPWNPAKEDQATDRAYRIGQTKPVWVHYPTIAGDGFESFEQRIASRLAAKRALSRDMLAPQQQLGLEDFEELAIPR
jgi:hypothetical protein